MRPRSRVKVFSLLLAALLAVPLAVSGSVFASVPSATVPSATVPAVAAPRAASPLDSSPLDKALLYKGLAFDACQVPSFEEMRAWRTHSPFGAIGIYIGGVSSTCQAYNEEHLTQGWVKAAHAMGWRLIPIYVGLQVNCPGGVKYTYPIDASKAGAQGKAAANDAIAQMVRLGLGAGNPIYYNMEAWNGTDTTCTKPVLQFMDAWTVALHKVGYISGIYASAGNGMPAIVTAKKTDPSFHAPDAIWFARHDNKPTYFDVGTPKYVADDVWTHHQRIKQYRGPHDESHGGVTINIDSNYVDGPVTGTVIGLTPAAIPLVLAATNTFVTLKVPSGEGPYSFSVVSGELPPGLKLSSNGKITGKATKPGSVSAVTIRVTDSGHPTRSGSRNYLIYTTYSDVPADQLFFNPIKWLATNAITFGYSDGTFRPAADVNRGSMAAFLYRLENPSKAPPKCTKNPFPDVATDSLFCGHITWLKGQHITKPADGKYHASNSVTRGSMTAFLYRLAHPGKASPKCTGKPFPDVSTSNVFCGYIQWAAKKHIAFGYPDGTYGPNKAVTRGAMAAFLKRL